MSAQLISSSPGAGKTRALATAIRTHNLSARIVTGNLRLAAEMAAQHGYALIQGRNESNCERYDVVRALGSAGHDIEKLADFCFWHHPDHTVEAAGARQLGGLRRKREGTLQGAYELDGLDTVAGIRRFLEVAMVDLMSLENSVARNRAIIGGALAASKLMEVGEMEERIQLLEATLGPRLPQTGKSRR